MNREYRVGDAMWWFKPTHPDYETWKTWGGEGPRVSEESSIGLGNVRRMSADVARRLLIEKLTALAERQTQLAGDELDQLKARFMAITSASPDTLAELERLGYESVAADERQPGQGERSGLTVSPSGLLLSQLLEELRDLPPVALEELSCSYEEFRAAITALWALARALEWSSFDATHIAHYPPEKASSLLNALVRSLRSYRETAP